MFNKSATTQQGAWRVCRSEVKEEPAQRAGDMSAGKYAMPLAGIIIANDDGFTIFYVEKIFVFPSLERFLSLLGFKPNDIA